MVVKIPTAGWCQILYVNGRASAVVPAALLDIASLNAGALMARDDGTEDAAAFVPFFYVSRIEYYTDAEKKDLDEKAKEKEGPRGKPLDT